jgi:hypothetical protein
MKVITESIKNKHKVESSVDELSSGKIQGNLKKNQKNTEEKCDLSIDEINNEEASLNNNSLSI